MGVKELRDEVFKLRNTAKERDEKRALPNTPLVLTDSGNGGARPNR